MNFVSAANGENHDDEPEDKEPDEVAGNNKNSAHRCCCLADNNQPDDDDGYDDDIVFYLFSLQKKASTRQHQRPEEYDNNGRRQRRRQRGPALLHKRSLLFRRSQTIQYLQQQEQSNRDVWMKHHCGWIFGQRASHVGDDDVAIVDHLLLGRKVHVFLLLQPYGCTTLEYSFGGRLIRWENRLIRAVSLNGYVSTLGGGFFLCHHFRTAITLALRQMQLALFLDRPDLYLACCINVAYSHLYAGYFTKARKILAAVEMALRQNTMMGGANNNDANDYKYRPTLLAMCKSAKLQCQRMKKAAAVLSPSSIQPQSGSSSTTVDDFLRIRVASDRSQTDDLRHSLPHNY
jgi:hypothetical protein